MFTSKFWKTYTSEYGFLVVKVLIGVLLSIVFGIITDSNSSAYFFAAGYILSDPFIYYFMTYKKKLAVDNAISKSINDVRNRQSKTQRIIDIVNESQPPVIRKK